MAQEFQRSELIRRCRTATADRQRIYRCNIIFLNTDKAHQNYESHKIVNVNGRNYQLIDGKDHILPEEVIEALKDAVGFKSVQTREQDMAGGINYDNPDDQYVKIKIDNFIIQIIEDVTPRDLREKLAHKYGKASKPVEKSLSDEEEERLERRASIPVVTKIVDENTDERSETVYPEPAEDDEESEDKTEPAGRDAWQRYIGATEIELD